MKQKPQKDESTAPPAEFTGTIARFLFRNPDTGFAVVRLDSDGGDRAVSAVGQLAQLSEGQRIRVMGRRVDHPRFGDQIQVEVAEATVPTTVEGIRAYLASSLIKGIGPSIAERITDAFGTDALRVIEEEPQRLSEVKGLGKKRVDELVAAVHSQKDVQQVMIFLRTHGLGQALATRIVKRYGRGASALIQANPYRLVDDVIGVGFHTADRLAGELGIQGDAAERVQAGTLHTLTEAAREGHCFMPGPALIQQTAKLLSCRPDAVAAELNTLAAERRIAVETTAADEPAQGAAAVYPAVLHTAEVGVARCLSRLLQRTGAALDFDVDGALSLFERSGGIQLPEGQRRAIATALQTPVSVITGGPGVGKTTIIRALTEIMAAKNQTVLLAAPTGRAAKRLEESTGRDASTIHRLLEYQAGTHQFLKNDREPLIGDLLVVDEASMLDVQLAYNLLRAVPPKMRLVLVGDVDQLPAVGPGNVLDDVITSGCVAVTALTEIFRQHGDSDIVRSAHGILRGEVPQVGGEDTDFFFVESRNGSHARELVREMVQHRIPKAFDLDPLLEIQVLCPMYRGDAGADAINRDLQDALNPRGPETERGGRRYRRGDKVMQIRNDYDLDVFNGDVGRIVHLDNVTDKLRVRFGDRVVEYSFTELDQLVPAYAITVHRAQGSEYPAVIIPVMTEHYMMLRRPLIYTAITRGKRLVVLVGSSKALQIAVANDDVSRRHSRLAERLRGEGPSNGASRPRG